MSIKNNIRSGRVEKHGVQNLGINCYRRLRVISARTMLEKVFFEIKKGLAFRRDGIESRGKIAGLTLFLTRIVNDLLRCSGECICCGGVSIEKPQQDCAFDVTPRGGSHVELNLLRAILRFNQSLRDLIPSDAVWFRGAHPRSRFASLNMAPGDMIPHQPQPPLSKQYGTSASPGRFMGK